MAYKWQGGDNGNTGHDAKCGNKQQGCLDIFCMVYHGYIISLLELETYA